MYVLIYVFISKYCQYYSDSIRCQAKLVHTFVIYLSCFCFLVFSDRGEKYTAVYKPSLRYILRLYIVTLFQRLPTQFIHTYSYYFQLPPPPLSSFDLLFLLGVGGGEDAKSSWAREHCSERKKKILIPGGEYKRYLT